jgi:spoIIIJ-associated protein
MESAEGTGKSVQAALEDALGQLGATVDEVEYEVAQQPGSFLGRLRGQQYRVRATRVEPTAIQSAGSDEPGEEPTEQMQSEDNYGGMPHQDLADAAQKLLQEMIDLMGLEARAVIEGCDEDEVRLDVEGDDLGLLIGRHGATLDAIQLIVAIGANRDVDEGARVIVDAEDYRARHRQIIEGRAIKLAEEAVANGQEVVVPGLKAYERRLMHLALKEDPTVETYSEGEGQDRVLVISPVE